MLHMLGQHCHQPSLARTNNRHGGTALCVPSDSCTQSTRMIMPRYAPTEILQACTKVGPFQVCLLPSKALSTWQVGMQTSVPYALVWQAYCCRAVTPW